LYTLDLGYTVELCHQLCQDDRNCQFFSLSTAPSDDGVIKAGVCKIYGNGACSFKEKADLSLYAKSNYHEDVIYEDGSCTVQI
jgi:hypothetical protein